MNIQTNKANHRCNTSVYLPTKKSRAISTARL